MAEGHEGGAEATSRDEPEDGLHAQLVRIAVAARLFDGVLTAPWPRMGRFRVERRLGSGGMGEVFAAVADDTGERIALKTLHADGPKAFDRLKREFRALSGVVHPHLVRLYELHLNVELPFLTMELVEGVGFLEHVRPGGQPDHERLRTWLLQMADALEAIHASGQLHHDIKPSNLRVRANGELVVLDFGLARAIGMGASNRSSGTPAYMAPERRAGLAVDEGSDWYSVGVVLYEALSGECPSVPPHASGDRSAREALPMLASTPAELRDLCARLLSNDRRTRPQAGEVRAALGVRRRTDRSAAPRSGSPFVGREREIAQLNAALDLARAGNVVLAYVHGEPGIGKTALASKFIAGLQAEGAVMVLRGRCHPREFIAYNAIDGLIDSLHAELRRLNEQELAALGDGLHPELVRLFPSLCALRFPTLHPTAAVPSDPQELRQRGFEALRTLLQRCADRRPLVLHIDDLQWADADSAALLIELLQPAAHRLLFVGTFRSADAAKSQCISALRDAYPYDSSNSAAPGRAQEIGLGPLSCEECYRLTQELVGDATSTDLARAIAHVAEGSPLFVRALVQHRSMNIDSVASLHDLWCNVIDKLTAPARDLLELVALADRPVSQALLSTATRDDAEQSYSEHFLQLEQLGLLRSAPLHATALHFECYHDRVRETVAAGARQRRSQHARLARAAEAQPDPDLEFVAHQYAEAGARADAARFAALAGDRAQQALAFEHAAKQYELALQSLAPLRPAGLLEKRAYVLAAAGNCATAAPLYLEAADDRGLEQRRSLELRLRAAEMYLRSGQLERTADVARPALRAVGARYADTSIGAKLATLTSLLRLRLRGVQAKGIRRPPSALESLRIDACFRMGRVLGIVDPPRGAALILRSVLLALKSGTDAQIRRAFASCAWMLTALGIGAPEREAWLLADTARITDGIAEDEVSAWIVLERAVGACDQGRFPESLRWARALTQRDTEGSVDGVWMRSEAYSGCCANLLFMGAMRELDATCLASMREAERQGNRFHAAVARGRRAFAWCARGEPRTGLRDTEAVLNQWADHPFCLPHVLATWAQLNCQLYVGDPAVASDVAVDFQSRFRRAGFLRVPTWGAAALLTCGSVALACAFRDGSARQTRRLRQSIRAMRRYPMTWAANAADLLEAGRARLSGDLQRSATLYGRAAAGFECCRMLGHAAAARARQAELLQPEEAIPVCATADAWFITERIAEPAKWTRMYAPGPDS